MPARLSQQQIDQLHRRHGIADVLPLTPLQRGLLFHACAAKGSDDDAYAVQLDFTIPGPLDPHRLREAVQTVVNRHPNLVARFCPQFDEPVQVIPAEPVARGAISPSTAPMPTTRSSEYAPLNVPRSTTSLNSRLFGRR
ncbi:condensation domain protein [Mycobacterium xenopi 4042]|uniref:Condensation domain protein n=1 Tax=Mycobacterium xenopi 4042 TaxID=1299334 RepID=X8AMU7_MYCXE|nr:condensation domain protein [Mycobacterium xenopi 3993]EUA32924.1 condensation domain protein [Mycobacterium xenopi 4042]